MASRAVSEAPNLREIWALTAHHLTDEASMVNFTRIRREAGPLLEALEAESSREVGRTLSALYRLQGRPREIGEQLIGLGITSAAALGPPRSVLK